MAVFSYKARNASGEAIHGQLEAGTIDAAASQLLSSNITPIEITETKLSGSFAASLQHLLPQRKPGLVELIFFSRQLYILMRAGVPIISALNGLAENIHNTLFAEALQDVAQSLESGRELSTALSRHPHIFNHLFVSMVQIGESTGQLDLAFLKLSQYLEREKDTRDRIKQAMRYPVIVVLTIFIAITIVNIAVIPKFKSIFDRFGSELPWQTQFLLTTSEFSTRYWPYILFVLFAVLFALRRYIRTAHGHLRWDRFKLRIPIVGKILYEALLARFATSFALTVRSGVPLIQALNVVSHAVDNRYVGEKVQQMRSGIERGDNLTRTAAATKMFTPLTIQMLSVGEDTGSVDEMLDNVAEYYEREVDFKLKNLSSAIEPILIFIVGAMVLLLAFGVFLPMWDLAGVVRQA